MERAANTAALANQAAHDTNARIRLLEHLDARRRGKLKAIATKLINRYPKLHTDADDIVNGMLVAVYEGYCEARFIVQPSNESFYALVRKIIWNLVSQQAKYANTKGRSPLRECVSAPADIVDAEIDGQRLVDCNDLIECCIADINAAPNITDDQREKLIDIFLMRIWRGLSLSKIAEEMGLGQYQVKLHFERLGRILKHRLEDLDGDVK